MVFYLGPMGSAPDTTLGPHVFGVNYFSNSTHSLFLFLGKKKKNVIYIYIYIFISLGRCYRAYQLLIKLFF
jgi:hypothetical protein